MAITWRSKDPDEIDTRRHDFTAFMDPGEGVVSYTATVIAGTVVMNNPLPSVAFTDTYADYMLAGGVDGETAVFDVAIVTDAGRRLDETIIMGVVSTYQPVGAPGYVQPSVADLITRYPSFAAVSPETIQAYLTDAARDVDETWTESDFTRAIIVRACDLMTAQGIGVSEAGAALGSGLASVKSGTLSVSYSSDAQRDAAAGISIYSRLWADLVQKNKGGPRVTVPIPLGSGCAFPAHDSPLFGHY